MVFTSWASNNYASQSPTLGSLVGDYKQWPRSIFVASPGHTAIIVMVIHNPALKEPINLYTHETMMVDLQHLR